MEQEELNSPSPSSLQLEGIRVLESFIKTVENPDNGKLQLKMVLGAAFELTPQEYSPYIYSYILKLDFKGMTMEDEEECIRIKTMSQFSINLNRLPKAVRTKEAVISLLSYNAPSLVFPYIRSYVASMTAMAGDSTFMLPTLNLISTGDSIRRRLESSEALQAIQFDTVDTN